MQILLLNLTIVEKMANVKSFHGMKRTQHRFFLDAVNEIEKKPSRNSRLSVECGPLTGGQ